MSTTEDTVLSQYNPGFRANLNLAPQQTDSRLLMAVDSELAYDVPGQMFNADDVQPTDPEDIDARVPDTPDKFIGMTRRVGFFAGFQDSAWIDNVDVAAELVDPTNKYMAALMAGRWRKADAQILAAAVGTAYVLTGPLQNGAPTPVAFPGSQLVAATDVSYSHDAEVVPTDGSQYGMSTGKLLHAGALLDESELEGERFLTLTSEQKADLLRTTPATSRYYTEVQALQDGKLNYFMGFNIIRMPKKIQPISPVAGHDGVSPVRRCAAWVKPAMVYKGRSITDARIRIRTDKSDTPQAFYKGQHGGVRRYDAAVVAIDCYEGGPY